MEQRRESNTSVCREKTIGTLADPYFDGGQTQFADCQLKKLA